LVNEYNVSKLILYIDIFNIKRERLICFNTFNTFRTKLK
jgi:hypothetical protein